MKLESRVLRSIARRKSVVVLRAELAPLGSPAQLSRVLAKLVKAGALVRVSSGVYAKTRWNKFSGQLAPAAPFEAIAAEAFRKLGIKVDHGALAAEYNAGLSTQVPMLPIVSTGRRRISRKIQVGSKTLMYERPVAKQRKDAK
jgi:di/tripeptidase